jgi:ABC-2 type transport system permease protein
MYDQRRALIWWSLGIVATMLLMALLWPSVREIFETGILSAYPEPIREVFGIEDMTTGTGFLNVEVFSIVLPIVFIVFAIGRGARLIAGEERDGVLEPILVTPASRTSIALGKALGLAVGIFVLGAALFGATLLASITVGMDISVTEAAIGALSMTLLGLYAGWLALGIGATTGSREQAIAGASIVLTAGYILHVVGALLEEVEPWRVISPFTQAIGAGPLNSVVPTSFLWLALTAIVFLALSIPAFRVRDIGSA